MVPVKRKQEYLPTTGSVFPCLFKHICEILILQMTVKKIHVGAFQAS